MSAVLLILFIVFICKTMAKFMPRKTERVAAPVRAMSTVSKSHAALEALQAQRDLINEQLRDIDEQLDYCPPAKLRTQYMNRKTALLGKLATCESKISRLCFEA